jgi:hypothetical protein
MGKIIFKAAIILFITVVAFIFIGRLLFVRTVNYEIAGISIPSKYNILTGKVTPIADYKGTGQLKSIQPQPKNIGLSEEETAAAKIRWAIFEQWVSSKKEFAGWESDPEIFRRANEAFRDRMEKEGPKIRVVE